MSSNIIRQVEVEVKNPRFVSPVAIVEPTPAEQFVQGKRLYVSGKPLAACVTDEQSRGWLAAEEKCEDAYWLGMMAGASTSEVM